MAEKPKYPETLAEAIEWANRHKEETGQGVETVPNPDKGIYFNIIARTVTRLDVNEAGKVVEVTKSCDTGRIVKPRDK